MPMEKICYVHMPKCGGTSLMYAIRNPYLYWDATRFKSERAAKEAIKLGVDMHAHKEACLVDLLNNSRYNYVMGHFRCTKATVSQFSDQWNFITLLRNPVDRWFSHYFYNRFRRKGHFKHEMDIEEYLETESSRAIGSLYVRFLSSHQDARSSAAIADAIENLETFALVGLLEKKEEMAREFEKTFQRKLHLKKKNKSPAASKLIKEIRDNPAIEKQVEQICKPDLEVYNSVLKD